MLIISETFFWNLTITIPTATKQNQSVQFLLKVGRNFVPSVELY